MTIHPLAHRERKKTPMTPTKKIALSFLAVIIIGAILLSSPIANKGAVAPIIDNLFIAVSAVCVTGLAPITLIDTYNLFGQIVIMFLIQIGGLGFITFLYLVLHVSRRQISLKSKMVFTEALNQESFRKLPIILKTIFAYTFIVEGIAAILLSIVFVPEFGIVKGIYYGIWHAVSGFCNAGFDLLGSDSLIRYQNNALVNFIICAEIILGGIGFLVVRDLIDSFKKEKNKKTTFSLKRYIHSLTLHTKIVFIMTFTLLAGGTIMFLLLEYNNPQTIGNMSWPWKIGTSFFQSTTTRTAGFATVSMLHLRSVTKLLMCMLMFVGGSPASTAGGIKTVTFALVVMMLITVYKGQEEVIVFNRRVKKRIVLRAFSIFALGLTACIVATMILSISEGNKALADILMEVFSAFGTVGLSASVTPTLTVVGKMVIIVLMYMGRIGPISLMILFARKSQGHVSKEIRYPDEDVIVG